MSKGIGKDINWEAIRQGYLLGDSADDLAQRFGVKSGTIRSRASRQGWITPRNIEKKIAEHEEAVDEQLKAGLIDPDVASEKKNAIAETRDVLKEQQRKHRETVAEIVRKKFKNHKLPAIKTWKDAKIADDMARRSLEMDKEDESSPLIQIGLLGNAVIEENPEAGEE